MAIDWTLIRRSIISSLAARERQQLEEWLEESPEHRELYRDAQSFLTNSESFRPGEERIRQFKQKYEQALTDVQRRRRRSLIVRLSGVAAMFVMALGVAYLLWFRGEQEEHQEIAQVTREILPGTQKAILVTGTGETIDLSREEIKKVAAGVKIKDNSLIYADTAFIEERTEDRLIVPRGGEYSVLLNDGTRVWVNSASELRYPVHFTGNERKVYLKGEAYFQVAHNCEKAFIVVTDDVQVKVYGTEFNINTRVGNYVQTTLVNGSVSIRNGGHPEQMLKPDQMAEYSRADGEIRIMDVDVSNYVSWKSGLYVFEDRSIEQIMEELALWYDVEVFFQNNEARRQRFSGSLPRYREINVMLDVIAKTSHVRFEVKGTTINVRLN